MRPFALASLCAVALHAQITAELKPLADGTTQIRVTNGGTLDLAAFALKVTVTNGVIDSPLIVYSDSAVDAEAAPLEPNQERLVNQGRRFVLRGRTRVAAALDPRIVTAGISADGSTTGDADLCAHLLLRRANMLQAVELATDMLSDAVHHNIPRGMLIQQFTRMADSLDHWYLPPEQKVGRSIYQSIAGKLANAGDLPPGSAFPPSQLVEEETANLHRHRTLLLNSQPSLRESAGSYRLLRSRD